MFEIGFTEILLILGIALLVLGPERLPGLARQIGRWAGRARGMARQFREQLDEEVLRHEREWDRPGRAHASPGGAGAAADRDAAAEHPAPGDTEPVLATIPASAGEVEPEPVAVTTTEDGATQVQVPRSDSPASPPADATANGTMDATPGRNP